jgi:hypothetical protein
MIKMARFPVAVTESSTGADRTVQLAALSRPPPSGLSPRWRYREQQRLLRQRCALRKLEVERRSEGSLASSTDCTMPRTSLAIFRPAKRMCGAVPARCECAWRSRARASGCRFALVSATAESTMARVTGTSHSTIAILPARLLDHDGHGAQFAFLFFVKRASSDPASGIVRRSANHRRRPTQIRSCGLRFRALFPVQKAIRSAMLCGVSNFRPGH